MRRVLFSLLLLGALLVLFGPARASTYPNRDGAKEWADSVNELFGSKKSGNTTSVGVRTGYPIATTSQGLGIYENGVYAVDATRPEVKANARLPLGNTGKTVDTVAKMPLNKGSVARGMVEAIKKAVPIGGSIVGGAIGGVAGSAISALIDYGINNLSIGEGGQLSGEVASDGGYPVSSGGSYYCAQQPPLGCDTPKFYSTDPETGCHDIYARRTDINLISTTHANPNYCYANWTRKSDGGYASSKQYRFVIAGNCPAGWYVSSSGCIESIPADSIDEQAIIDKIALDSGWPTSAAIATAGMWEDASLRDIVTADAGPVELTGPASVPGAQTTTTEQVKVHPGTTTEVAPGYSGETQPATKESVKTETHNVTYQGNNVTYNTVNNTVTNITNNVTNETTIQEKTETVEDDAPEDESASDTPLPDLPTLYERKYPEGMVGIWNTKSQQLKESSLSTFAASLMPTGYTSGICPSWQLDLSFAQWADMGTVLVEPPCWIWDVAKTIIVISALLLARSLIFGG